MLVYYLHPYGPDLNPIEELFAKVKSVLKASEHTLCEDIETLLANVVFISELTGLSRLD